MDQQLCQWPAAEPEGQLRVVLEFGSTSHVSPDGADEMLGHQGFACRELRHGHQVCDWHNKLTNNLRQETLS